MLGRKSTPSTTHPRSPIPEDTPAPRLRALLAGYVDPDLPVPTRYRARMVARILALLAGAAVGRRGDDARGR